MDMQLQILLLASLLVCVCSRYVPKNWMGSRDKRQAMPHPAYLHNLLDKGLHYRRHLYNVNEDDDNYNGDSYNSAGEDSMPADSKMILNVEKPSYINPSMYQPEIIHGKSAASALSNDNPSVKRRLYDQTEYERRQKNQRNLPIVPSENVISKRYSEQGYEDSEHYAPPKYGFKYSVHDIEHHDIKHHEEEREGDHTVGEYSVLQPDGTILTVKYTVHGDEGFNAVVTKSDLPKEYEHSFHHAA